MIQINDDNLEQKYCEFRNKYFEAKNDENVEYFGLNFAEDQDSEPIYKVYYTTKKSRATIPNLLKVLEKRNMIRAINKIDDTINKGCIRYEVGLGNRTNLNMEFIYNWIFEQFSFVQSRKIEIEKFCNLKCSNLKDYRYAALYYIGMIIDFCSPCQVNPKAIKLHYLLRECKNPEKIGKDFLVDNVHIFEQLNELQIYGLHQLVYAVSKMLHNNEAELWMVAVDYYNNDVTKYKIYFKKFSESVYENMIAVFREFDCIYLVTQVENYIKWISFHPELERYGIAICLDSNNKWSVNFYH